MEEIREIPGFPERFVSANGEIYKKYFDEFFKVKSYLSNRGYLRVGLYGKKYLVHRLVLLAFIGPCPTGYMGLHKDDNRLNCNLSNLYWGTRRDNYFDMIKNYRKPGRKPIKRDKSGKLSYNFHKRYTIKAGELIMTKINNGEKINIIELGRIFSNKNGNCAGRAMILSWIKHGAIPPDGIIVKQTNTYHHYYFDPNWVKKIIDEHAEYMKTNKIKHLRINKKVDNFLKKTCV